MLRFWRRVRRHRLLLWTFRGRRERGRSLGVHGLRRRDPWIGLLGGLGLAGFGRWTILNRLRSLLFGRVSQPNRGSVLLRLPIINKVVGLGGTAVGMTTSGLISR